MRAGTWLMGLAILACMGASVAERPSPAGLTTIVVRGDASNVVLVDPRGRINRSDPLKKGEVGIPKCMRWDGGTGTTLDDSSAANEQPESDVVTELDLSAPIVGRYRLYLETRSNDDRTTVNVTPVPATSANEACPDLKREIQKRAGRYVWNIEFLPDSGRTTCPIRLSGPFRTSTKK